MLTFRIWRGFSQVETKSNPKVFFDVTIGGAPKGRLIFEVYLIKLIL
jgi:hypothetical protein